MNIWVYMWGVDIPGELPILYLLFSITVVLCIGRAVMVLSLSILPVYVYRVCNMALWRVLGRFGVRLA